MTTRKQCKTCPWRKGTDPHKIPNGYSVDHHLSLRETIAEPGDLRSGGKMMACHYSPVGEEDVCVGWLSHQLGPGNNLALRMKVIRGDISADFETLGPQHETFEDTLPPEARR